MIIQPLRSTEEEVCQWTGSDGAMSRLCWAEVIQYQNYVTWPVCVFLSTE